MDGILIINKSKGLTSHDVDKILKKELNIKKIGHSGTLDPNATGILPILLGKATKIEKYLTTDDKTYIAQMKLGEERDTLDSEGKVVNQQDVETYPLKKIEEILSSFVGKQEQIPPIYSAIKVNGKKAYEYARNGQVVELEPRQIEIYDMKFLDYKDNIIKFQVKCSKGTYIRTLCKDIAKKLGTIAYMKELERTKVGQFTIDNSVTIENIKNKKENIDNKIISIEEIFKQNEKIYLSEKKIQLFLNGVQLTQNLKDGVYTIYLKDKFVGLGIVCNKLLKRDVVIE